MVKQEVNGTVIIPPLVFPAGTMNALKERNALFTLAMFFLSKLSATATLDCTCLGHLGLHDTERIISIYVTLPKVAKASKY